MLKNYANDDQICLTSVVFIPKEISSKIISSVINKLKEILVKEKINLSNFNQSLQSYLGYFSHANSHDLAKEVKRFRDPSLV